MDNNDIELKILTIPNLELERLTNNLKNLLNTHNIKFKRTKTGIVFSWKNPKVECVISDYDKNKIALYIEGCKIFIDFTVRLTSSWVNLRTSNSN